MAVLSWMVGVLAVLVTVPCAVFVAQCLLGVASRRTTAPNPSGDRPRLAVLVPAHDEEAVISNTLRSLEAGLADGDRLLVVADNCTDRTAEIARAEGAECIERMDQDRRGKGYALEFGFAALEESPPDVVIIVDADCEVEPGSLERLARLAAAMNCPVQADYVLTPTDTDDALAVISGLAFMIKNRVRPRGMASVGLPCQLTGSGMAFPWSIARAAPPTHGHLVEDMVMGIELARLGYCPRFCGDAFVSSKLASTRDSARVQRRRWEHGHLASIVDHAPRLLLAGIRQLRIGPLAMGFDLLVPPLALLCTVLLAVVLVTGSAALFGAPVWPLVLGASAALGIGVAVFASWFRFGRPALPLRHILAAPLYVLWKVPLYLRFVTRGRHGTWERTGRGGRPD